MTGVQTCALPISVISFTPRECATMANLQAQCFLTELEIDHLESVTVIGSSDVPGNKMIQLCSYETFDSV